MAREYTVYDYWRILRRRKWTILLSVLLVTAAAYYFSARRRPVYRAAVLCEVTAETVYGAGGAYMWYSAGMMDTEVRVAQSRVVIKRALEKLGDLREDSPIDEVDRSVSRLARRVSVSREGNTNLLRIEVTSEDPEEAALYANTVAQAYIEVSQWQKIETGSARREFMASQLEYVSESLQRSEEALMEYARTGDLTSVRRSFTDRLETLKLELRSLESQYTPRHPRVLDLRDRITELQATLEALSRDALVRQRLERDIKINEELYFMLSRQHKEMLVAAAGDPPRVRVIDPAVRPAEPVASHTAAGYAMGGTVGLIFGIILAFFKEHLDTSIGTIEELEEFLKLPVLGVIPYFTADKDFGSPVDEFREKAAGPGELSQRLILARKPKSSVAEAFRTMETNIDFAGGGADTGTLLVTSTTLREGKSITSANFALAAAQAHKKVLLVEADLRAPVLHRIFGVPKDKGLSEVLIGKEKITDVIKDTTDFVMGPLGEKIRSTAGIDNFKLITSGKLPPNPLPLFQSGEFKRFLEKTKQMFDVVILDVSPILPVADSTVISSQVDGVVVIYKVGVVIRGALKRAISQLTQAKANVLGVVLNQIRAAEMKDKDFYYRYYHKYYGEES